CIAAGRRDRNHEHHAGVGHRANPRDRNPNGYRGPQRGDPTSVPDRVSYAFSSRRNLRNPARCGGLDYKIEHAKLANVDIAGFDLWLGHIFGGCWSGVRLLPCAKSCGSGSDRSSAIRIKTAAAHESIASELLTDSLLENLEKRGRLRL